MSAIYFNLLAPRQAWSVTKEPSHNSSLMMIPCSLHISELLVLPFTNEAGKIGVAQIWTIGERELAMSNERVLFIEATFLPRRRQQWKGGALFICGLSRRSRHSPRSRVRIGGAFVSPQ